MPHLFLGLDIGTSSCKGVLVSAAGEIVAQARVPYSPDSDRSGYVEQDPRVWVEAATEVCGRLGRSQRLDGIAAVGVAGQMRGVTFLDRVGVPVRKSILWNDTRCTAEVAMAEDKAGAALRRITINPLNTMASLPKLLWVMAHEPDVWQATQRIVLPKDFVTHALTGTIQTDLSDASGTSLFDLRAHCWSAELLALFEIAPGKLPPVNASSDVVGAVTRAAAVIFGIPEGVPVIAGGSDSVLDTYAALHDAPDALKVRLGTSGALSRIVDDPADIGSPRLYCWSYVTAGRFLADLNTRSCAQSVDWFCGVAYRNCASAADAYAAMAREAESVEPGCDGLVFRPHLQGEDAPFWDPTLTASFSGLTARHGRAHMARAVFEGTAFALADAWSVAGRPMPNHVHLVGGGTRIRVWTEIVGDVLGCAVTSDPDRDTAFGAAILAGRGSGLVDAKSALGGTANYREPDASRHAHYRVLLETYRSRLPANAQGDRP